MSRMADMYDMIDFQTPLQGMDSASASVDRAASRIAAIGQPSGDTVDLSTEMVALIQARNDFGANVKAAQTVDEISQSLLNIVG
jgi:flagellar hook-associated protein FlgK